MDPKTTKRRDPNDRDDGFSWRKPEDGRDGALNEMQTHALPLFDLTFLGSGASVPSRFKSSSCSLLSLGSQRNFLFDAGEGAMRQSTRSSLFSLTDVSNIFITHMHADHILGLPSVVHMACTKRDDSTSEMSENKRKSKALRVAGKPEAQDPDSVDGVSPLRIYGPQGLHKFLSTVVAATHTKLRRKVIVYEMLIGRKEMDQAQDRIRQYPAFAKHTMWHPDVQDFYTTKDPSLSNTEGVSRSVLQAREYDAANPLANLERREVQADHDGTFHLFNESYIDVKARLISHKIPCMGYVVTENDIAGNLDAAKAKKMGIPQGACMALVKNGHDTVFPDGSVVPASALMSGSTPGRKLTVLGDTNDASNILKIAANSDLVVHEASYANELSRTAWRNGHATPSVATDFAKKSKARRLVLNHVGSQYLPWSSGPGVKGVRSDTELQEEARNMFRPQHCIVARDFVSIALPPGGYGDVSGDGNGVNDNRFNITFHGISSSGESGHIDRLYYKGTEPQPGSAFTLLKNKARGSTSQGSRAPTNNNRGSHNISNARSGSSGHSKSSSHSSSNSRGGSSSSSISSSESFSSVDSSSNGGEMKFRQRGEANWKTTVQGASASDVRSKLAQNFRKPQ